MNLGLTFTMPVQVANGCREKVRIIAECSKPEVAFTAQKLSDFPGDMVVIDSKMLAPVATVGLVADGAKSALPVIHGVPLIHGKAMGELDICCSVGSPPHCCFKSFKRVLRDLFVWENRVFRVVDWVIGAARLVRNASVKPIHDAAPLAWLKNPAPGAFNYDPGRVLRLALYPLPDSFVRTLFAVGVYASDLMTGFGKVSHRENLLAKSAYTLAVRNAGEASAFVSKMPQEAHGRSSFFAPGTGHGSLWNTLCSWHWFSICQQDLGSQELKGI